MRVRAASLTALVDANDRRIDLKTLAERDPVPSIRAMAVRSLVQCGEDASRFLDAGQPAEVRLEAIASLKGEAALPRLLQALAESDPFLRSAAVRQLSLQPELLATVDVDSRKQPLERIGLLLAWRASGRPDATRRLAEFLGDADEDVRFLAVKWIADWKLLDYRPQLVDMLKNRTLNVRLYSACSSALARLDDRDVSEARMIDYFLDRLRDEKSPPALRVLALQMVPANHPKLTLDLLRHLLSESEPDLQREAVRSLSDRSGANRARLLLDTLNNPRLPSDVRATAILGLSGQAAERLDDFLRVAQDDDATLRDEALRALKDVSLNSAQRMALEEVARNRPESAALVARVLGRPFVQQHPRPDDLDGWLKHLEGKADVNAGRRVFFHPKLASCFRCHRVEGRGQDVGPDLSTIGRTDRRHILESILRPSNLVAPHYQVWQIETNDGKVRNGMLLRTELDVYTYLDAKGEQFKLNTRAHRGQPGRTDLDHAGRFAGFADRRGTARFAGLSVRSSLSAGT